MDIHVDAEALSKVKHWVTGTRFAIWFKLLDFDRERTSFDLPSHFKEACKLSGSQQTELISKGITLHFTLRLTYRTLFFCSYSYQDEIKRNCHM